MIYLLYITSLYAIVFMFIYIAYNHAYTGIKRYEIQKQITGKEITKKLLQQLAKKYPYFKEVEITVDPKEAKFGFSFSKKAQTKNICMISTEFANTMKLVDICEIASYIVQLPKMHQSNTLVKVQRIFLIYSTILNVFSWLFIVLGIFLYMLTPFILYVGCVMLLFIFVGYTVLIAPPVFASKGKALKYLQEIKILNNTEETISKRILLLYAIHNLVLPIEFMIAVLKKVFLPKK